MSDGPHRSLPMRPGWKRVAEYGDNRAFAPQEVCNAIPAALEEDCRAEMAPRFLDAYCDVFRNQESSLFKDQVAPQLEALRGLAGLGMGRVVLDHAIQLCESGETGTNAAVKAVADALTDRAARGARQVEEHYCRESTQPRADHVRSRIEEGIGSSGAGIETLARKVLKLDAGSPTRPAKQQGLDDGVRL